MTSKLSRMRYGEQTFADFEIFQGLPMKAVKIYSIRCIWKHFENHQILIEHKYMIQDVFFIPIDPGCDQSAGALMLRLTHLVRCVSERVIHISTLSVQNRVRAELLRLAQISSPGQNIAVIFPAPTHAGIADRISTHREAVTREFGNLSRAALLERRNSSLIIKDVKKHLTMASDMLGE